MSEMIFEKLNELLSKENAKFRVLRHESAKTSQEVAIKRGTKLGQGAKALVCMIKSSGEKHRILAVLPADLKADLNAIAATFGAKKASLASPNEVSELTDCVFGAIPPFSFHKDLMLIADPSLFERFDEIAFNAGLLDRSIVLNTQDYKRIANPTIIKFAHIE